MHSLSPLFAPRSVAVIGASSDADRIGGRLLRFLIEARFEGAIYPVNRSGATEIQGLRAYASVRDVPGSIDQAVIVVPVAGVEAALRDSIDKGVRCVFSREEVRLPPQEDACAVDGSLNCHGYGSSVMVTASFGMAAAAQALELVRGS